MLKLLASGLAGILFVPFALNMAATTLPTPTLEPARWVHEALTIKAQIAAETRHPQILVVAGSNALFGVSAKTIQDHYGIPATNLAVNAGLGRDYILAYARTLMKPGDLVVLPLEYELYETENFETTLAYQLLAHDRAYYAALPPMDKLRLLANIRIADWLKFAGNRIVPDRKLTSGYQARTLNERGDETNNVKGTVAPELREKLTRQTVRRFEPTPEAIAALKAFDDYARSIDARTVLAFPNFLAASFDATTYELAATLRRSAVQAGLIFVGQPDDRLFDLEHAHDTVYHPNNEGQISSTNILMKQLREAGLTLPHEVAAR
jgi:hypothetical protein